MTYLLDTNILLHFVRSSQQSETWNQTYQFFDSQNILHTSMISVGEIESLAHQLSWGDVKRQKLADILRRTKIVNLNETTALTYARIDAYSQNKLKNNPLPTGLTARNMGKNDIWLAATAHLGDCQFVTTDHDFDHLQGVYIDLLRL